MKRALVAIIFPIIAFHAAAYAQSDKSRLRTYVSAAEIALDNNRFDEAIFCLENAASIAADNFIPFFMLGSVYSHMDDNSKAAVYYTEALNRISADTFSQKYYECFGTKDDSFSYRKAVTTIYDCLSDHYKNIGRLDLAKCYNELNIQLNIFYGYKSPVKSSLEQIYFCYAKEGGWTACLEYFTRVIKFIPDGDAWEMCAAVCHAAMGDCYANIGQETMMIKEYQQAARLRHVGAIQSLKALGIAY